MHFLDLSDDLLMLVAAAVSNAFGGTDADLFCMSQSCLRLQHAVIRACKAHCQAGQSAAIKVAEKQLVLLPERQVQAMASGKCRACNKADGAAHVGPEYEGCWACPDRLSGKLDDMRLAQTRFESMADVQFACVLRCTANDGMAGPECRLQSLGFTPLHFVYRLLRLAPTIRDAPACRDLKELKELFLLALEACHYDMMDLIYQAWWHKANASSPHVRSHFPRWTLEMWRRAAEGATLSTVGNHSVDLLFWAHQALYDPMITGMDGNGMYLNGNWEADDGSVVVEIIVHMTSSHDAERSDSMQPLRWAIAFGFKGRMLSA